MCSVTGQLNFAPLALTQEPSSAPPPSFFHEMLLILSNAKRRVSSAGHVNPGRYCERASHVAERSPA
jgi:hypothetical protein